MNIEFNLENEETIFLSPAKKSANGKDFFDLIDSEQKVWMTLELNGNHLNIIEKSNLIIDNTEIIESKLDDLVIEIIQIEQSGTDSFGEIAQSNDDPYNPDDIKVRTDKLAIPTLYQMMESGDIDLNPDFQRNLVWENFEKSRLIESILLRIPLPMFYFAEDNEGKLTVVDGLQRITTIKDFMDNKFPLKNLQYLQESCGGKYYKSINKKVGIDSKYFRWFNLTSISANFIDPSSPYNVKYDIFRRINTGGRPLNNQEIRNCFTGQGVRDILKEMVLLPEFASATDKSIKSKRMDDQEIALRFLYFNLLNTLDGNIEEYNGYMDSSLDWFAENHKKTNKVDLDKYVKDFSNAMKNAEYLIGKKYAFRKITPIDLKPSSYKQLINKALFVCTSILLAQYDFEKVKKLNNSSSLLNPLAEEIRNDESLFNYLSYGTNGWNNLNYTFNRLKELFNKNIKY
jgi:hypothetical protein